jgi:hypothetical protein
VVLFICTYRYFVTNTIAGAGLPIHMIGEVSCYQKEDERGGPLRINFSIRIPTAL